MSTQIAEKCSEGNNETSEQIAYVKKNAFVATYWAEPKFIQCMSYLAYGKEVCPTTGRDHWQTWIYTKNQMTETALAKAINKDKPECKMLAGKNCKFMYGTFQHNDDYCSKESSLTTFGVKPRQGARHDLAQLRDRLVNGTTTVDFVALDEPHLYHAYGRTLHKIEDIVGRKRVRTEMTKGIWIYGKTGTGKSHRAYDEAFGQTVYTWNVLDGKWWDEYTGQDVVILNDFRGEIPFNVILQMVDKWEFKVSRRNRVPMPFTSKLVIITSSQHPDIVYSDAGEDLGQLHRRFKIIHHLGWGWNQFTKAELDEYRGV